MLFSSFVTLNWSCSSACDKPYKLSHPCYLLVHTFLLICKDLIKFQINCLRPGRLEGEMLNVSILFRKQNLK